MQKFIKFSLLFGTPILVIGIMAEVLLRQIPNDYGMKKSYLDSNSDQIETLILGSSHSFYGVNPAFISDKTFNSAYISQSLNYDFEILKKYNDRMKNLKTVIVPISYFSFALSLDNGEESWRVKNYEMYFDINRSKAVKDHSEILGNRLKVSTMKAASAYVLKKSLISCSKLGWGTAFRSENAVDLEISGKRSAKRHTKEDTAAYALNRKALVDLVTFCDQRNIEVLLFTAPAYVSYRSELNQSQLTHSISTAKEMALNFDNCEYLNLFESEQFVKEDYYDADHMNEIGAKKLTEILARSMKQ